jgi:hypothetical protein
MFGFTEAEMVGQSIRDHLAERRLRKMSGPHLHRSSVDHWRPGASGRTALLPISLTVSLVR